MLEPVAAESAHIPHWPGEYQGMLRAIDHRWRANSLSGSGTNSAKDVLRCLATVWGDFPGAHLEYDRGSFDG